MFIGTMLGSFIGAVADVSGAIDTFTRVQGLFYPELCVVGSNTILGEGITMAADWQTEFKRLKQVNVRVRGIGSVRGVEEAITGGCVHVLAMSEPMTETQYQTLMSSGISISCAAEIGYDIIAFITDINNEVPTLLRRQLSGILTGRIINWSELGGEDQSIRILARPGSGTTELVLLNVANHRDTNLNDNQYFPPNTNYFICESNSDCFNKTLATPGSLYWVSTAWMRTQPEEYLRVIPILVNDERPVNPLSDDLDVDEYPSVLVRPLYMYVLNGTGISDDSQALAQEFLYYVRSVPGQQIIEQHHFYTYFDTSPGVRPVYPPNFSPRPDGTRPVCLTGQAS